MNKRALLVGNGVNLLDSGNSFSWGNLLQKIKTDFEIEVDINNIFKPFPLAFDEMFHIQDNLDEKSLKRAIRTNLTKQLEGKEGYNDYHKKLTNLAYSDILTTNYDYSFENSLYDNIIKSKDANNNNKYSFIDKKLEYVKNKQEPKYSLKRRYSIDEKNIWHIHGELSNSRNLDKDPNFYTEESIMIGYSHYTAYLEKIQENIKGKSDSKKAQDQSLEKRLHNNVENSPFWTDIFFTHNIDIVGQGLDFSENHLWWLISYRANLIKNKNSYKKNTITFYYPEIKYDTEEKHISNEINNNKTNAIADLLEAFKVDTIKIKTGSYKEFYDKLLDDYL